MSVRWCTKLTEVTDDSEGSDPSLQWHLAVDTDNRLSGSEIFHERPPLVVGRCPLRSGGSRTVDGQSLVSNDSF